MILRCLTIILLVAYFCTKSSAAVTGTPVGRASQQFRSGEESRPRLRDVPTENQRLEEATTLSDNSFPESRLDEVKDGEEEPEDVIVLEPTVDNSGGPTDSFWTKVESNSDEHDGKKGSGGGHKKEKRPKQKTKKKKNSALQKFLPLLLIPFIIQAKIIPLFLFNLKIVALKALLVGKLAMLLVAFNMVRNMLITNHAHVDHVDTKYSMDHIAQDHYGYNGGPEYGSWVNSRQDHWGVGSSEITQLSQLTARKAKK